MLHVNGMTADPEYTRLRQIGIGQSPRPHINLC